MAEIVKRNKPLSVSPAKASSTSGAALAFLGFDRSLPLLHGAQGCTAFNKVFFVRHFREPIPLQTTALDQISTVMGSDENLVEGLRTETDQIDGIDFIQYQIDGGGPPASFCEFRRPPLLFLLLF